MPALAGFRYRGGTAPVTASLTEALAAIGAQNPHTGDPFTEAFLLGISGGATFGYFSFAYKGYDPQVALLTRNTFNNYGWDAITTRLGIPTDVMHSTSPARAQQKLGELLQDGVVPIVWADVATLGYEAMDYDDMWMMVPMIVSAYTPGGQATVHDRSRAALVVDADVLDAARAAVKKDKHRIVTIDLPERTDLTPAVREALSDCRALFDGNPPVGSGKNFGVPGYDTWMERLTRAGAKESWAKLFPSGRMLFAGLVTSYRSGLLHWKDESLTADRSLFADFLDEAAVMLESDELSEAAAKFRAAGRRWEELGAALLPDDVPILAEAQELLVCRHATFLAEGLGAGSRLTELDDQLRTLRDRSEQELQEEATSDTFQRIAEAVHEVRDADGAAIDAVRNAVAPGEKK